MPGTVQLEVGDIFNGPSDLIVLPCSTGGMITGFVRSRLEEFDIKYPSGRIAFGDVEFFPLSGAENIASYGAFAASVKSMESSEDSIERIGKKIGSFASENQSVQLISSPLLGTGAGGLDPVSAFRSLTKGFFATSPENSILKVCILHEDWHKKIVSDSAYHNHEANRVGKRSARGNTAGRDSTVRRAGRNNLSRSEGGEHHNRPIRVFISYTRTSDSHSEWVKSLATFLRENGIDARLDVWHLRLGMDVAQWMCNELDLAQKVIIICNEEYAKRADGRHGGVGWETRIVQGDLLMRGSENTGRYIPIIRSSSVPKGVPAFLRSAYGIHWPPFESNDLKHKQQLLKSLYQVQEEAPAIGKPPPYILTSR